MTYQELKDWCKENKNKIAVFVSFVLVFFVGFGVGNYDKTRQRNSSIQPNYNIKPIQKEEVSPKVVSKEQDVHTSTTTTVLKPAVLGNSTNCLVKGNISSTGSKIYHVLGGSFYKTVKPEQCFATEQEAVSAGFRKSSR